MKSQLKNRKIVAIVLYRFDVGASLIQKYAKHNL